MANSKAMCAVRTAVRRGELPHISTQKCVDCGKQAKHYDHRDYNDPLKVEPTCQSCNILRGPALQLITVENRKPLTHKNRVVHAKLTDTQYKKLMAHLKSRGMTISQWIANRVDLMRSK
jgi:hypothetical protein